jgi:hypothetical protein
MTMQSLTINEMLEFLSTSNCPHCHKFILIHCEQTESHLITSTGHCIYCEKTFMVDRSYPAPFEVLGGHSYEEMQK